MLTLSQFQATRYYTSYVNRIFTTPKYYKGAKTYTIKNIENKSFNYNESILINNKNLLTTISNKIPTPIIKNKKFEYFLIKFIQFNMIVQCLCLVGIICILPCG